MDREEAKEKAMNMARVDALKKVRLDLSQNNWVGIDVLLGSELHPQKVGIGNPEALESVRKVLLDMIDKQIKDEEYKESLQPKWRFRHFWER